MTMVERMVGTLRAAALLTDKELLAQVSVLAAAEREGKAHLIAVLAEIDDRRLYLEEGYPSMFLYCTKVLHLSEHAAYTRIEAARASQRFPMLLDRLADGSLHLTAVCLVAPHLTRDNCLAVVDAARHRTKGEIEELLARLHPLPPVPSSIRKLPVPRASTSVDSGVDGAPAPTAGSSEAGSETTSGAPVTTASSQANGGVIGAMDHQEHAALADPALPSASACVPPLRRSGERLKPLAPDMYSVQFTASAETCAKLRLAQNLLRHTTDGVSLAAVVDRALTLLVNQLQATKHGAVPRPRTQPRSRNNVRSRHIPVAVRREVWARDEGRCAFKGKKGRCPANSRLEFHHRVPFADGGGATADNIELRCSAHNAFEAERWFGANVARERTSASTPPDSADGDIGTTGSPRPAAAAGTEANKSDASTQLGPERVEPSSGPGPP
jgi:hypothetical protein